MAENIINNSYEMIDRYFIEKQKKYDEANKNNQINEITKNIKNSIRNGLIKDLNGSELFTPDYKNSK